MASDEAWKNTTSTNCWLKSSGCYEATSAVLLNGSTRDFFQTTVAVRQGCPLSSVLVEIMQKAVTPQNPSQNDCFANDAEEDAKQTDIPVSSVSIGGQPLCYLRFTDISLMGGSEWELQLTERLEKTAAGYGMEISSDQSKILVNSFKLRPSTNIGMNGKNAVKSGPVRIPWIGTNQSRNIN